MAVSTMIQAINSIFATPEYSTRIPSNVQTAITNGNYGTGTFTTNENNAVIDALVDKIGRQDIYQFKYNNFDGTRYEKGYLPFGGIIEDDYINAMSADNVKSLPSKTNQANYVLSDYDPFSINYPDVKPSYHMLKIFMQYHVTTTLDMFKRAFISESAAIDFVSKVRDVLPESGKLDKYLLLRNMLSDSSIYPTNSTVQCVVAGTQFTAQESIDIVRQIRQYVSAFKWNTTKYNKNGVLTSVPEDRLVLFMSVGIYDALSSAQYNAYHKDMDFGCRVELIDGFGTPAATSGQFATLIDERALKIYYWQNNRMDNIWNPKSQGYWNTFYSFGQLLGYSLNANIARFVLTDGKA